MGHNPDKPIMVLHVVK